MKTRHYHTTSNLDCLKVRVELRRVRDSIFHFLHHHDEEDEEKKSHDDEFRRTFRWQEKVYSPREIIRYTKMAKVERYEGDDVTVVEEYHLKRFREKIDEESETKNVTLFSYTDIDGFVPPESFEPLTTSSSAHFKRDVMEDDRDIDTMYLMASFGDGNDENKDSFYEKTLCLIRHRVGTTQLDVQPGFSREQKNSTAESGNDTTTTSNTSTTQDDWYRFEIPSTGEEYEYRIINTSLEKKNNKEEGSNVIEDKKRIKEATINTKCRFNEIPPKGSTSVRVFLEIVSAHSFGRDTLFVEYKTLLPRNGRWKFSTSSSEDRKRYRSMIGGTTQRCKPAMIWNTMCQSSYDDDEDDRSDVRMEPVAFLCYPVELSLIRRDADNDLACEKDEQGNDRTPRSPQGEEEENTNNTVSTKKKKEDDLPLVTPQVVFQVFAKDDEGRLYVKGYGFFRLPIHAGMCDTFVHTWKPEGGVKDNMANFLLGGQREIDDLSYIAIPDDIDASTGHAVLSKFGFRCKSSGKIRLRVNVLHQGYVDTPKRNLEGRLDEEDMESVVDGDNSTTTTSTRKKKVDLRMSTEDIMATLRRSRQMARGALRNSRQRSSSQRSRSIIEDEEDEDDDDTTKVEDRYDGVVA